MPSFGVPVSMQAATLYISTCNICINFRMSCAKPDNGRVLVQLIGGGSFFTVVIGLVSHSSTFTSKSNSCLLPTYCWCTVADLCCVAVCFVGGFEHSQESQQPWQAGRLR